MARILHSEVMLEIAFATSDFYPPQREPITREEEMTRLGDPRDFRPKDARERGPSSNVHSMGCLRVSPDSDGVLSANELFTVLWMALADILGTATAATLLRRAAQRAANSWPELVDLSITREKLEYTYTVPPGWQDRTSDPPEALSALACELWALLVDLTGTVVVNRLARIPELLDRGIVPREKKLP